MYLQSTRTKINFILPLLPTTPHILPSLSLSLPCPAAAAALLPWQQPVCEHKGSQGWAWALLRTGQLVSWWLPLTSGTKAHLAGFMMETSLSPPKSCVQTTCSRGCQSSQGYLLQWVGAAGSGREPSAWQSSAYPPAQGTLSSNLPVSGLCLSLLASLRHLLEMRHRIPIV